MPTGYTVKLMEKDQSFKDFAMCCARAFGACIAMRDDPSDAPIPEEFKPSDYYDRAIAETEAKLAMLRAMTGRQAYEWGVKTKTETIERWLETIRQYEIENQRLGDMSGRIESWLPPTPDHFGIKSFMLQQIDVSRHDLAYQRNELARLQETKPTDFYDTAIRDAESSLDHYREERIKEIERVTSGNKWLKALRESVVEHEGRLLP